MDKDFSDSLNPELCEVVSSRPSCYAESSNDDGDGRKEGRKSRL